MSRGDQQDRKAEKLGDTHKYEQWSNDENQLFS